MIYLWHALKHVSDIILKLLSRDCYIVEIYFPHITLTRYVIFSLKGVLPNTLNFWIFTMFGLSIYEFAGLAKKV
jgi:hypothetical protein